MRPELESIYQTAPIGLGVLDTELCFLRVNERLAEINGLPAEAHLGRTVRELLPDLAEQAEAILRRVLETGQPIRDLEVRGQTPAQPGVERVWIEQITPLRNESGNITRLSIVAEEVTERQQAQESLRRSQANLLMAMSAAGQAMWEWDVRRDRLTFTGDWEKILGYPPGEFADSRAGFLGLIAPADRDLSASELTSHLQGQSETYESTYRLRHASGRWLWMSNCGRVVERDASGAALRMVGVSRDITRERQDRDELEQLARLLHLAFDAIFVWTPEHGIVFWNRGAEAQYGYAADEARGIHPDELLKTTFPCSPEAKEHALATDGVWRGELGHQTKDGRRITVTAVMQRVPDLGNHVLEITRDVSDRVSYEQALLQREGELQRAQARLQVALDAGEMGVWDWHAGSNDAFWSPEVFKLLGLQPTSDLQTDPERFLQMVHPDDRPRVDAQLASVMVEGGDYESEFRVIRADGEVRWLVSRGRVLHGGSGPSRIVGVNFDITARKLIEQAMAESDRRRTEFLAMLAHELRNPLAPIANSVRLLEKVGDVPEPRHTAVQILRRQTNHLARLVDDLLEVSRITQGRIELRTENVLLATVISQAVEAARQNSPLGQEISVDIQPGLDLVGDPARLIQIISNLVTNAVKYTPAESHIEVVAREEQNDQVSIVVQDDGPGISPESQPHIFELFTQDKATLDRSQGGLGIGLALVKRLTELHGGHVRYEARQVGARFIVYLPKRGRREQTRGIASTATPMRVRPMPVLVVDDNEDAAETLATLLRLDGHRVAVANDGEEALRIADQFLPKLILLDLGLPRIDGLQVARRLRADHRFSDAVVIATTGYAQANDRAATKAAGFDEHLAKPVQLQAIYEATERLLGNSG